MTVDEVLSGARNQGIADLADVQLGILEADGKFSFVTRDEAQHEPDEKRAMRTGPGTARLSRRTG